MRDTGAAATQAVTIENQARTAGSEFATANFQGITPDYFRMGIVQDPQDKHRYHFWSLHPGGGNWALADGSVRFIGYTAAGPQDTSGKPYSPTPIEAMATRAAGDTFASPN